MPPAGAVLRGWMSEGRAGRLWAVLLQQDREARTELRRDASRELRQVIDHALPDLGRQQSQVRLDIHACLQTKKETPTPTNTMCVDQRRGLQGRMASGCSDPLWLMPERLLLGCDTRPLGAASSALFS
jgi:hypothetical protein